MTSAPLTPPNLEWLQTVNQHLTDWLNDPKGDVPIPDLGDVARAFPMFLAALTWRDIASAPKDGTHILIYCPVEDRIVSSRWIAQPATTNGGAWYGTDPMDRLNWIQGPTHWMPIPPPPLPPTMEQDK